MTSPQLLGQSVGECDQCCSPAKQQALESASGNRRSPVVRPGGRGPRGREARPPKGVQCASRRSMPRRGPLETVTWSRPSRLDVASRARSQPGKPEVPMPGCRGRVTRSRRPDGACDSAVLRLHQEGRAFAFGVRLTPLLRLGGTDERHGGHGPGSRRRKTRGPTTLLA